LFLDFAFVIVVDFVVFAAVVVVDFLYALSHFSITNRIRKFSNMHIFSTTDRSPFLFATGIMFARDTATGLPVYLLTHPAYLSETLTAD
jgi:hypothetical protein